jgi:hypothetical protein
MNLLCFKKEFIGGLAFDEKLTWLANLEPVTPDFSRGGGRSVARFLDHPHLFHKI